MDKKRLGAQTWIFPAPVLLVGALVNGKPNFMTVAWGGIACSVPPMLSVAIRGARYTLAGIRKHQVFSVNIPGTSSCKEADYCGVYSGSKVDKSKIFSVFYGSNDKIPLISECPVCIECKVAHIVELGTHYLVIGEITETHVDEDCLENNVPIIEKIDPISYASGSKKYYGIGKMIGDAYKASPRE
jgi:flavin reductase (DIM6/NTAB) family NADH-FMN oxidoreductase RutF